MLEPLPEFNIKYIRINKKGGQYEMNKNESKYFGTAILFDEALIYLLEKKDIEYITIKEIDFYNN